MDKLPFDFKKVLITGGTGSWGHELVKQLIEKYPSVQEIRIYSRNEHKQVDMKREFEAYKNKLNFIIGDIRDYDILDHATKGVDIIFHLAALKHVPICEENPWEAILTNIAGTQNVIKCALKNKVKKVVDVSTDKAVAPFNLYGVTKSCAEKLMVNANFNYSKFDEFVPEFICIRGGNVVGTNGSVIPLFLEQIKTNNKITITNPSMTRYLMSKRDAINLIFTAVDNSVGGELFVMNMPATTVETIANVMIKLFGNKDTQIEVIGMRPGEKMDEMLISKDEAPFSYIFSDDYYLILPQIASDKYKDTYDKYKKFEKAEFSSKDTYMNEEQLEAMLRKEDWLFSN